MGNPDKGGLEKYNRRKEEEIGKPLKKGKRGFYNL